MVMKKTYGVLGEYQVQGREEVAWIKVTDDGGLTWEVWAGTLEEAESRAMRLASSAKPGYRYESGKLPAVYWKDASEPMREPAEVPGGLRKDIEEVLNKHSAENGSNTPDFILAEYITDCLEAFDKATNSRERWYGREGDTRRR